MICILCSVDFEDLAGHLGSAEKNKCSRVFTTAYKGYALTCHGCDKELGEQAHDGGRGACAATQG